MNLEMLKLAGITSSGVLQSLHKKLVVQRSEKSIFSKSFPTQASITKGFKLSFFYDESITTATDTAMLRVVMAAVEGKFVITPVCDH